MTTAIAANITLSDQEVVISEERGQRAAATLSGSQPYGLDWDSATAQARDDFFLTGILVQLDTLWQTWLSDRRDVSSACSPLFRDAFRILSRRTGTSLSYDNIRRLLRWAVERDIGLWARYSREIRAWFCLQREDTGFGFSAARLIFEALLLEKVHDVFDGFLDLATTCLPVESCLHLSRALYQEADSDLRTAACLVATRLAAKQRGAVRALLLRALRDPDEGVRETALSGIEDVWNSDTRMAVAEIAARDPSRALKTQAEGVLAALG
jgi:hypothetical protein